MIPRRFSPSPDTSEQPAKPKSRLRRIAGPVLGALAVAGFCLPEVLVLIALAGTLTLGLFLGVVAGGIALAALVVIVVRYVRATTWQPG